MNKYEEINSKYIEISSIRLNINNTLDKLNDKISYIKTTYQKYISNNNNNVFGLDNLFFQNQLLIEEHNNLSNMYKLIENKIYGDYYKLLKLITTDINTIPNGIITNATPTDYSQLISKYPAYKDLETLKMYEFKLINSIHEEIVYIIKELNKVLIGKKVILQNDIKLAKRGFSLGNYLHTCEFNNLLIKEKIKLYIGYLTNYNIYHKLCLEKINNKLNTILEEIDSEININLKKYNSDSDNDSIENESIEDEST